MAEKFNSPIESLDGLNATSGSPHLNGEDFLVKSIPGLPDPRRLPFTPIDEKTGIPLPLHPEGIERDSRRFPPDEHHPWHPRRDPLLLGGTLGGRALRYSRVQLTNWDHHHVYYHNSYHGPDLPSDDPSRFSLIVLSAAGYIPEQAIAFNRNGKPYTKPLSHELRAKLWESKNIRIHKHIEVQKFLREYTYQQDLSDIKENLIDEFLFTNDPDKRWQLGNELLGKAVYRATNPIKDLYKEAKKSERIPPQRARAVSRFVLTSLGMRRHRDLIFEEFGERLKLQAA